MVSVGGNEYILKAKNDFSGYAKSIPQKSAMLQKTDETRFIMEATDR
jgi:hypothetical protein